MASVREALGRLEQLRLVEVRHGEGMHVLDWRRSGGLEALVLQSGVDHGLARDCLRRGAAARRGSAAGRRASQRGAGEDARRAGRGGRGRRRRAAALLADWSFMAALVESAGNIVFQLILNSVRELYLPTPRRSGARRRRERACRALRPRRRGNRGGRRRRAAAQAIERLAWRRSGGCSDEPWAR